MRKGKLLPKDVWLEKVKEEIERLIKLAEKREKKS